MSKEKDKSCLDDACRDVAAAAGDGGWQLALAESCTGGLAAARLTAIAGASQWFAFGIVSYANDAKMNILAVPAEVLQRYGAVSEQTAAKMCAGAMMILAKNNDGDDIKLMTIAITGIAGPGGDDNDKKPVGTVCFGWQIQHGGKSQKPITETVRFSGGREEVREQSAAYALQKAAAMMSPE